MLLEQILLSGVRNLKTVDLKLGPKFNVLFGENGSGKTSVLEAIHILSMGKSFRTSQLGDVLNLQTGGFAVRGQIDNKQDSNASKTQVCLEVKKPLAGRTSYKISGVVEKSISRLTKALPVQLINESSHLLLEGGPEYRRRFLDWGVFHVEHQFLQHWQLMQRILIQRNAELKIMKQRGFVHKASLKTWNTYFVEKSALVNSARERYFAIFLPIFKDLLFKNMKIDNLTMSYKQGWEGQSLKKALDSSLKFDLRLGYTSKGPHRADVEILLSGKKAKLILSRGQIKMFACIMFLARAYSIQQNNLFLIDDLNAELDVKSSTLLIDLLDRLGSQVFITGIEKQLLLANLVGKNFKLFHVEHGKLKSEYE